MNTYYSNSSNIRIVFATNIRIPKNHYSPNPNIYSANKFKYEYTTCTRQVVSACLLFFSTYSSMNCCGHRKVAELVEQPVMSLLPVTPILPTS